MTVGDALSIVIPAAQEWLDHQESNLAHDMWEGETRLDVEKEVRELADAIRLLEELGASYDRRDTE